MTSIFTRCQLRWLVDLEADVASPQGFKLAGVPNKVTRELKELAQSYTEEALRVAASIMRKVKASESNRLEAAKIILDRGHGRAPQAIQHSGAVGTYDLSKLPLEQLRDLRQILGPLAASIEDQIAKG